MKESVPPPVPMRRQAPVYALAFCYGNIMPMVAVVMPFWALELTDSPLLIGLIVASRQFLVVALSIYGGALLDRGRPRRVMTVLAAIAALSFALFPLLPHVAAAIMLQMISGFAETTNWIGAQAMFGRLLRGRPLYAGRLTAAARVGGFIGPWFIGLAWQIAGPAGAFALLTGWVLMGAVAALFLPDAPPQPAPAPESVATPRLADYTTALRLLVLPAVALVILATFLRQAGTGIQASFYGVWLMGIGFEAGEIGLLIGLSSLAAAVAALGVGGLARRVPEHWLLIAAIAVAVAAIAVTPALDSYALLVAAICLRGVAQGLNLPLMMSIAARAAAPGLQGRMAALRITFNRFGGALVPVAMGGIAEAAGLEAAFYLVGAAGIAAIGLLAVWVARTPAFGGTGGAKHSF